MFKKFLLSVAVCSSLASAVPAQKLTYPKPRKAGHGAGKPTAKIIQEQADIYGFFVKNLGIKM